MAARFQMARRNRIVVLAIALNIITLLHLEPSSAQSNDEAENLLKFKESLKNSDKLSAWTKDKPPCNGDKENWVGILCEKGTVWGLQLHDMGLSGTIDIDTLTKLKNLRTMSFMQNNFEGQIPNLSKLPNMKTIYLSHNKFSGKVPPESFNGLVNLKKLHMANNQLTGKIPDTFASLPKLTELMLDNNQFEGPIPGFTEGLIKTLNVSNNKLEGEIPTTLKNLDPSSFGGNKDLCGGPLKSCTSPKKLSVGTIIALTVLVLVAVAALIVVVMILRCRSRQEPGTVAGKAEASSGSDKLTSTTAGEHNSAFGADLDKMEQGEARAPASSPRPSVPAGQSQSRGAASGGMPGHQSKKSEANVKITFLRDDQEEFDMTDLLKASAEVLGSGVFGSTYKAALNGGQMMVVKRYKHMNNVNKEEFHEHMRRLGRLNHPNVLPVVGFYYRKEEKLLITDYVEKVSLAVHLHGSRSRGRPSPNWPTRLSIIKGIAKGLLYLNNELPSLTAPHGHLKSSNILLDRNYNPLLNDYALIPVVNQEHAQEHMTSYKSPEYKLSGRITKKTDVWAFGILILEILTGRFPSNFIQQGRSNDTDVASWVESVVRADNETEVFDADMDRFGKCEDEMMKLLKIGLNCCDVDVDNRPDMKEVVEKVEVIKEVGDEDEDEGKNDNNGNKDVSGSGGACEGKDKVKVNEGESKGEGKGEAKVSEVENKEEGKVESKVEDEVKVNKVTFEEEVKVNEFNNKGEGEIKVSKVKDQGDSGGKGDGDGEDKSQGKGEGEVKTENKEEGKLKVNKVKFDEEVKVNEVNDNGEREIKVGKVKDKGDDRGNSEGKGDGDGDDKSQGKGHSNVDEKSQG